MRKTRFFHLYHLTWRPLLSVSTARNVKAFVVDIELHRGRGTSLQPPIGNESAATRPSAAARAPSSPALLTRNGSVVMSPFSSRPAYLPARGASKVYSAEALRYE